MTINNRFKIGMRANGFILAGLVALSVAIFPQFLWAESLEQEFQKAVLIETSERDLEKAILMYQEIANRADADSEWQAKVYYQIGLCQERLGKVPEAIAAYENAIKVAGSSPNKTTEFAESSLARLKQQQENEAQTKLLQENAEQNKMRDAEKTAYDIKKGAQFLSLAGGIVIPLTEMVVARTGGYSYSGTDGAVVSTQGDETKDTLGEMGPSLSLQYAYHLSPRFGIGMDFGYAKYSKKNTSASLSQIINSPIFGPDTVTITDSAETYGKTYSILV